MSKRKNRPIKEFLRTLKKHLNPDYWQTKKDIVLVYNPGKVGSTSVTYSLKKSLPWLPATHIHFLTQSRLEACKQSGKWPFNLIMADRTNLVLQQHPDKTIKIITLVRDPIGRDLSGIFQGPTEYFPNKDESKITADDIIDLITQFDHSYIADWFDGEFKEYLNFDIYSQPFDKEKGYTIYQHEGIDILCIKLERLSEVYPEAVSKLLGTKRNILRNKNEGDSKALSTLYSTVKKRFKIEEPRLREIYNSKFMQTFYTNEEIESFISKWKA